MDLMLRCYVRSPFLTRSCRARLQKHNARRRRKAEEAGVNAEYGLGSALKQVRSMDMDQAAYQFATAISGSGVGDVFFGRGGGEDGNGGGIPQSLALAILANAAQQDGQRQVRGFFFFET